MDSPIDKEAAGLVAADASNEPTTDRCEDLPEILTADEVAALLRVNRKTVYAALRAGEIPGGRKIRGTIRFSRLLEWMHGQPSASRSPGGAR